MNEYVGILLLDKPVGITSNAALQQVKRLLGVKTAGHTGSLDPLASGMLPVCLGKKATKFSGYLLNADKQYEVCMQLGICTTTGDAEGEVTERYPLKPYSHAEICSVLETFTGEIEQTPPMFSAIKQKGRPLYKLAREGTIVERDKRKVHIHKLQLLNQTKASAPFAKGGLRALFARRGDLIETLTLFVHCSKGTYIRTLVEDIGKMLGCGAYVTALRRIAVGNYTASQMVSLATLEDLVKSNGLFDKQNFILPVQSCLTHLPNLVVDANLLFYLRRGQAVQMRGTPLDGLVTLSTTEGEFIGIGEVLEDGKIAPKRL